MAGSVADVSATPPALVDSKKTSGVATYADSSV